MKTRILLVVGIVAGFAGGVTLTSQASAMNNGINALIAATQIKAQQANEAAMDAAEKQEKAVEEAKKKNDEQQLRRAKTQLKQWQAQAKRTGDTEQAVKKLRAELAKRKCK